MDVGLIILIGIAFLVVITILAGVKQVPQGVAVLVERLGEYEPVNFSV